MTKGCTRCKAIKELHDFGTRAAPNGHLYRSWCRACESESQRGIRRTDKQLRAKVRLSRHQKSFWTEEQFQQALKDQDGKCKICECHLTELRKEGTNTVHADHHPMKNTPRALLCRRCNAGLGMFQDSAALLRVATAYLDFYD